MSKRTYNIYFHLHTISGILITVGLYVIFFAGAFTLFLDEIQHWESENKQIPEITGVADSRPDLDKMIRAVEGKGYDLHARSIYMDIADEGPFQDMFITASEDKLAVGEAKKSKSLRVHKVTYEVIEKKATSATLADLLYELHFFYQLGEFGYYLSGVVSLFFLFAMVSGIIVHWKKIISNFYLFRPYEKLKTVWTDAHTALGTIGIPFQFMYALTGSMFGLSILIATSGSVLYGGDEDRFYEALYGNHEEKTGARINPESYKLNHYLDSASSIMKGFTPNYIAIDKSGSETMLMSIYGEVNHTKSFFNDGEVVFNVIPGTINHMHTPKEKSYPEIVSATMHRLHFGEFSLKGWKGIFVRIMYFVLAMATCFVIITGVLIWLEARNKKSVPEKQRRFNEGVGYVYLAICLSMFPVTALSFIASKLIPESMAGQSATILNTVFFGGWLLCSSFFWLKKSNYFTNKYALLSAGVLGLCVPVVNGLASGNWFWHTLSAHRHHLFFVDALWLVLSLISFVTVNWMKHPDARTQRSSASAD